MKDCTTCKYGYEDEQLGIRMCHHPKRFSVDCDDFNMHEEKEIKESEKPFKEPIDGVLYAAACGIKNKGQIEKPEKPLPADLEEAANEYAYHGIPDEMKPYVKPVGDEVIKNFIAGAEWQKEQDNAISRQAEAERIKTQQMCYEKGQADMKRKMMEDSPKWRRIKAGERLPCPAYVWTIAYDNYPDCFEGRLMPNIQGVKVGRDTWYLPVDVIHNLPKED